ncbi:MAG: PAS domain S-box protein [Deltaproteobacteria bacterium]|nr:MAG: PAS domain S-box protein [Deltaproteobacteria bacterium]
MAHQPTPDERRFRALASSSVERITELDARGRVVYVGPSHGRAQDDVLDSLDHVHPDDRAAVAARFAEVYRRGEPERVTFRVIDLAGATRWIESTITPFPAEDGERHVLVVSRDVSQARELEHRLRESRERFQLIAENAYDMIVEYDSDWKLRYANDRAHAVFGIGQSDFESRLDTDFGWVHPDNRNRIKANFERVTSGELDVVDATYRSRRADGSWCWIDATLRRYLAADGEPHFLAIARDVTERFEAEQRVRDSERRYRELVENAPLGIFVVQDNRIVFANAAAAALHGSASPAALCGTNLSEWLNEADVRAVIESVARSSRGTSGGGTFTLHLTGADGRERRLSGVGTMITYAGAPAFQCIVRDVTELERSRRDQEYLSLQLQEARKLESLGVLAGGIAHDFNNLLAVVLSSVRYARSQDATPEDRSDALSDAEEATESAARLVKQLLAYARRRSPEVRNVDLSEMACSLTDLLSTALPGDVALELDLAREPLLVRADVVQLEQVLMNLVLNAADAVSDGPGVVTVRTSRQYLEPAQLALWLGGEDLAGGWYACLAVEDTGAGMDAETRTHIFEPFFTTKQDGHGLGLSAVLGLVQGHRGAIDVASEPGRGTRMRVFLPADDTPVPSTAHRARAAIVLVAEPDGGVRGSAAEILRGAGMEVIEASAAQAQALLEIHDDELDAAVVDGALRAADGRRLVQALHADRPDLPLLALGAPDDEPLSADREALISTVRRPFAPDALRDRVARLLAKRDARG